MRGYKCDRCGQWHSGLTGGFLYENRPDDGVYAGKEDDLECHSQTYDLCPECFRSVLSYMKNSAIGSD